ncbi:MAG: proton-conducting transporter membrane subunit, partial [Limisphaerales bacterium]
GNVQQEYGTPYFRKVTGVIRKLPWTGGLLLVAALAVIGAPPFSIFQSEFTALSAALDADRTLAAALFVAGVVTIFAGFLAHMARLNFGAATGGTSRSIECRWKLSAMLVVGLVVIGLGIWLPAPLYELVQKSARIVGGAL